MKEHPILFSGPLVRAILDGRKTQTRRLLRVQPSGNVETFDNDGESARWHSRSKPERIGDTFPGATNPDRIGYWRDPVGVRCPYGKPGDRLWVRETWAGGAQRCAYKADGAAGAWIPDGDGGRNWWPHERLFEGAKSGFLLRKEYGDRWRPSIHMPRWASRINLEVTEVRVQRLLEITEEDAQAEGVRGHPLGRAALDANGTHKGAFLAVWEAINGTRPGGSIADNPWVWAVSFKRVASVADLVEEIAKAL